jgi:hypothetical protein
MPVDWVYAELDEICVLHIHCETLCQQKTRPDTLSRCTNTCFLVENIRRRFHGDKIVRHLREVDIAVARICARSEHVTIGEVVAGNGAVCHGHVFDGDICSLAAVVAVFAASWG